MVLAIPRALFGLAIPCEITSMIRGIQRGANHYQQMSLTVSLFHSFPYFTLVIPKFLWFPRRFPEFSWRLLVFSFLEFFSLSLVYWRMQDHSQRGIFITISTERKLSHGEAGYCLSISQLIAQIQPPLNPKEAKRFVLLFCTIYLVFVLASADKRLE